jgi:predicted AlkP superfamily phosphohydrolase/phosphomutase
MNNKVLLIGIDSLDPRLLVKFGADLPHFSKLRAASPGIRLRSIFPPDSIPAWITIHTGLNPARHGLIYVFDIFESQWQDILNIDLDVVRGRTFWDRASDQGKKVCVLFPFVAFPPWRVNGLMVSQATGDTVVANGSPWQRRREVRAYPPEAASPYRIPPYLASVSGKHPGEKNLKARTEDEQRVMLERARLGLEISRSVDWDLFFIFFGSLDGIQHALWRYGDETDPTYPGPNALQDLIRDSYRLLDGIVGQFLDQHPGVTTIVMSDHGHGMRPPTTVNINELLRRKGFLRSKGHRVNPVPRVMEGLKRGLLDFVHDRELDSWLVNLSKMRLLSAASKSIYMSTASIDMERTVAYLSSFAGPKSYGHGGIEINRENLNGMPYEELRASIIQELSQLREPDTGEPLMEWISRREDLYSGPYVSQFPDIVFELKEGYGVYWGIHTPLIGTAYEHNLASGGHKKDAVFLVSGAGGEPVTQEMTLMDVAPTILDLLGLEGDAGLEGRSIFAERRG